MRRPQVSRPYSSSTRPPFASLHHLPPRSHLPTSFQTASSSKPQELQLWQRLTMPMPSFADSLGSSHTGSLRLPWDAWRKYGNGREFQVYGSCCVQYCSEGLQGPRLQTSADFVKAMGRMTYSTISKQLFTNFSFFHLKRPFWFKYYISLLRIFHLHVI